MADEFMRAVATIAADDKELRADLRTSEEKVRHSVNRMQGDFDRLQVQTTRAAGGFGDLGIGAIDAGASVAALSATASIAGGKMGSLAGQLIALSAGLGKVLLPAAAVVGALGAIVAGTVRVAETFAGVDASKSAVVGWLQGLTNYIEGTNDAATATKELTARLKEQRETIASTVAGFEKQRAILLGAKPSDFVQNVDIQNAMISLERTQGRIKRHAEDEAKSRAEVARIMAEETQLAQQKQAAVEATARVAQSERDARQARFAAQGPTTATGARTAILEASRLVQAGLNSAVIMARELKAFGERQGLSKFAVERIANFLGMPTAQSDAGGGPRGSGVSANAYAFGYAAMGGGGGTGAAKTERLAEKTAKATERVADSNEKIEGHMAAMAKGAG